MKPNKSVLITDLDNTLFDWFNIWYKSFKPMFDKVLEISEVDSAALIAEIKAVHQEHGTAEYAFLLESIPVLQAKYGTSEAIRKAMTPAIEAFREARVSTLKLYPTVESTLQAIKESGALVVVYTESKSYYSSYRINKLGLDKYIDYLFTPPDHKLPDDKYKSSFNFQNVIQHVTPEGELKPNPQLLKDIIENVGSSISDCVYIGDSEMKDIEMAQKAGVDDVFAKYGTEHFNDDEEAYNLLRSVTHWTDQDVAREKEIKESSSGAKASIEVNTFSEIMEHYNFVKFKG
ncbi:HAD-IA family hydrolase [Shewanella sp. 3_MG-2023]|uniref:HAD family hydrolase n=1 Tax=Shewanella sp. 3_MG-2023 TaxID=3062635 RepID=UPI0026E1A46C|nr:HAD-IA family hydrolase [Shewanella sp. 3_MG-2023]MDO6775120.1 HAD-IA family hydrolase [Shewanella sp. 3_MG-2023]